MKIVLSREEIELNVAFGLEFLDEVKPPEGFVWKCDVHTTDEGELVAECVAVPQSGPCKKKEEK